MNTFKVGSLQLKKDRKWAPAGTLFTRDGTSLSIQEDEFGAEYRFNTREEADDYFRSYYLAKGYKEEVE